MQGELDGLVNKLRTIKITDNHEDYNYLVSFSDKYNDKSRIFGLLRNNNNSLTMSIPLIFTFASKLDSAADEALFVQIIDFIRGCKDVAHETSEWIIKILFVILEKIKERRKDSEIILRLLECIKLHGESTGIVNHLINLMYAKNSGDTVASILDFMPDVSDEFIRCSMKQSNPVLLKNLAMVLTQLSEKQIHLFVNYQHFDEFLDSEHFFMRSCFLEICMRLAEHFKEREKMEELNDVVCMVVERLADTYFLVRYKGLQVLDALFEKGSIVLGKRAEVIREVSGRILDKTVIVRKKAVSICSGLLMNHPFISEKTLERKELRSEGGRKRDAKNASADIPYDEKRKYYEDLNQFHDIMKEAQDNVLTLLGGDTKTEINECIEFIKLSFYYKIAGSKEAFESLFDLVWSQDMESLLLSFKDLLAHVKMSKSSLFDFLGVFVRKEGNPSFEKVLRELSGRRYIDKSFVADLGDMFFQGVSLFETSYLLLHIGRPLSVDVFHQMLLSSTQLLFASRDKAELIHSLAVYKNIAQIKTRERVEPENEVTELLIKNLVKMTFFEYQIVDITVEAIYSISKMPEKNSVALLEKLCSRNENSLKLISAVGCVGLRHLQYIEGLEKLVKASKATIKMDKSVVTPDIRERRRSINASRQSLSRMIDEEVEGNNTCMSVEEPSLGGQVSSKLTDKSEEEIADFFFYIKEREMLYGDGSILPMFKEIVEQMCMSTDDNMQLVAHTSLYKVMCISSEFFTSHYEMFIQSLRHPNPKIRANAIVAMSDFLLNYNTVVEGHTHLLFEALGDSDAQVKKNALLVIHNLLSRNILKIKGYSTSLTFLLMDKDAEIRGITERLLRHVSERESTIATIFYEAITAQDMELGSIIDFLTELVNEKTKESLFIKALRSKIDSSVLEYLYQVFNLSEKFIGEICHLEEFKNMKLNELQVKST